MLPRFQAPAVAISYYEQPTARNTVPPATTLYTVASQTDDSILDEDCTTTSSSAMATSTVVSACNIMGPHLSPTQGAVIALSLLSAIMLIAIAVLFLFYNRARQERESRNRDGTTIPPHSTRGSYPLIPDPREALRYWDQRGSRRRRVYDGLGMGESRDGRIYRRHSVHGTPLQRSPFPSPRPVQNPVPGQQRGFFPRASGVIPGYPQSMRNTMPFAQAQAAFRNAPGVGGAEQGGMAQPQAPMMQREERFQHAMRPDMAHMQMPPVMRNDAEHMHVPGSRRGEGDAGSAHGTDRQEDGNAPEHEDIFTRMQRQAMGRRRMSRAETEGSRGSRGRSGRGDRFGEGLPPQQ